MQIHKKIRKILIILINDSSDSNHSLKFTFLVIVAFVKKEERQRQRQQAKQTHNLLLSFVVFLCESYLFCGSYECRFMDSRNQ